jgi:hypothetical protein
MWSPGRLIPGHPEVHASFYHGCELADIRSLTSTLQGVIEADIYISVDIEADGPIPGPYSMLSFGLAVAAQFDGHQLEPANPEQDTFYREMRPISDSFVSQALDVSGLDRNRLIKHGVVPLVAMSEAKRWVEQVAGANRPVLVGYPLMFDWLFFYWYLEQFAGGSPFDFSSGLDMKTMYQQKAGVTVSLAGKDDLPAFLRSARPHTHNALDDAIEQADIFVKLFQWKGP